MPSPLWPSWTWKRPPPSGPSSMPSRPLPIWRSCARALSPEPITRSWCREYRRLFVGPGHLPAPPWGSVYTDHECVIFGEATLALRAWMRACGIERTTDERTPEDHIGLMLALLSFLAVERPELVDDFLRDHLLTWAPHYLDTLEEAATHSFYEGLARLTRATLAGIQRERGLVVDVPRFYR